MFDKNDEINRTRWPGKAISGLVVMAILARACVAFVTPTDVPPSANESSALKIENVSYGLFIIYE
jgi:hypothetical protein